MTMMIDAPDATFTGVGAAAKTPTPYNPSRRRRLSCRWEQGPGGLLICKWMEVPSTDRPYPPLPGAASEHRVTVPPQLAEWPLAVGRWLAITGFLAITAYEVFLCLAREPGVLL